MKSAPPGLTYAHHRSAQLRGDIQPSLIRPSFVNLQVGHEHQLGIDEIEAKGG